VQFLILNEFAEVILGGSIAIPVAVAFWGFVEAQDVAKGGRSISATACFTSTA
jgi:hypothetical protein